MMDDGPTFSTQIKKKNLPQKNKPVAAKKI
jgi:hypothetical protein